MGEAYECDSCGKFFPGSSRTRHLPSLSERDNAYSSTLTSLELCKECIRLFDIQLFEMYNVFLSAHRKRKGNIKNDPGHPEG